jgi:hypothetical protein
MRWQPGVCCRSDGVPQTEIESLLAYAFNPLAEQLADRILCPRMSLTAAAPSAAVLKARRGGGLLFGARHGPGPTLCNISPVSPRVRWTRHGLFAPRVRWARHGHSSRNKWTCEHSGRKTEGPKCSFRQDYFNVGEELSESFAVLHK